MRPYIVKMTWSCPKKPCPQRIWFLFSSLSPSKFSNEISDLLHQCYQLADCSAADLKRGRTKSWTSVTVEERRTNSHDQHQSSFSPPWSWTLVPHPLHGTPKPLPSFTLFRSVGRIAHCAGFRIVGSTEDTRIRWIPWRPTPTREEGATRLGNLRPVHRMDLWQHRLGQLQRDDGAVKLKDPR